MVHAAGLRQGVINKLYVHAASSGLLVGWDAFTMHNVWRNVDYVLFTTREPCASHQPRMCLMSYSMFETPLDGLIVMRPVMGHMLLRQPSATCIWFPEFQQSCWLVNFPLHQGPTPPP
jgi:hypothetical protein